MINELRCVIKEIIPDDSRPIVIYSAIWPFAVALKETPLKTAEEIMKIIFDTIKPNQTIFMPTFCRGYNEGICDLDREESTTGLLSEVFRKSKGVNRTQSAFFSFSVYGKDSDYATNLIAKQAWGEGSLYEWFHERDAHIITLGTHPTHCSFTHRAEWLARDVINYRYEKSFEGILIRNNKKINVYENLFVRCLNPSPLNDWTWLTPMYMEQGMKCIKFHDIDITEMSAKKKMDIIVPMIYRDPLVLVKNRELFERNNILNHIY